MHGLFGCENAKPPCERPFVIKTAPILTGRNTASDFGILGNTAIEKNKKDEVSIVSSCRAVGKCQISALNKELMSK